MRRVSQALRSMLGGLAVFALWALLTVLLVAFGTSLAVSALIASAAAFVAWRALRARERDLRGPDQVCHGIAINRQRAECVLLGFQDAIATGSGTVSASKLCRLLARPEVMRDLKDFQLRFMSDLLDELSDGELDWNNEKCDFFFDLMRSRHKLSNAMIIAGLVYVAEERRYDMYQSLLGHVHYAGRDDFFRELALHDVCCDTPYDPALVERFAAECGVKGGFKSIEKRYRAARRQIEMTKFESMLRSEVPSTGRVAEQIRSDVQRGRIDRALSKHLDTNPDNYIIVGSDHSRESRLDAYYRRHFSHVLSRAFDGHCCACAEGMDQLQFDHFWRPKSAGGNFLMRSRNGTYVNNCIPLCASCNARKGNRDFRDVFDEEELVGIVERSQSLNALINEHMVGFSDPEFDGRVGVFAVHDAPESLPVEEDGLLV